MAQPARKREGSQNRAGGSDPRRGPPAAANDRFKRPGTGRRQPVGRRPTSPVWLPGSHSEAFKLGWKIGRKAVGWAQAAELSWAIGDYVGREYIAPYVRDWVYSTPPQPEQWIVPGGWTEYRCPNPGGTGPTWLSNQVWWGNNVPGANPTHCLGGQYILPGPGLWNRRGYWRGPQLESGTVWPATHIVSYFWSQFVYPPAFPEYIPAQAAARPLPVPRVSPRVRPSPRYRPRWREHPEEHPDPTYRPRKGPALKRYQDPAVEIGLTGGDRPAVRINPRAHHNRVPPGPGQPERKRWKLGKGGKLGDIYGGLTEIGDALDAIASALPKHLRAGYARQKGLHNKAGYLALHLGAVDLRKAIEAVVADQVEDALIAAPNRAIAWAIGRAGKAGYYAGARAPTLSRPGSAGIPRLRK